MIAAESLSIKPAVDRDGFRFLTQAEIQRRIATASRTVGKKGGRVSVVGDDVFTNHERLTRAVRDFGERDRLAIRLTKENPSTTNISVTIEAVGRRVGVVSTANVRGSWIIKRAAARLVDKCVVEHTFVTGAGYVAAGPLVLVVVEL